MDEINNYIFYIPYLFTEQIPPIRKQIINAWFNVTVLNLSIKHKRQTPEMANKTKILTGIKHAFHALKSTCTKNDITFLPLK